jgi:putative DNA primase/helicase
MPRLNAVTHAIRRRIQMVPFRAVFDSNDPHIRERLKREALPAILAWIVEGAAKWHAVGTKPPKSVNDLTDEYIDEQDTVKQWVAERCDREGVASELSSVLYADYAEWCKDQHTCALSNKALSEALRSQGFTKKASRQGKLFQGLRLKAGGV